MRTATIFATIVASVIAAPFKFPLPNGFPNPSAKSLKTIEFYAGGSLPNTPLPTKATDAAINALRLISLAETLEVAYFSELLNNITAGSPGYTDLGPYGADAKQVIFTVRAQEELHSLGAGGLLKSLGETPISPCEYNFPVESFVDAIALAATFTQVVLSVLPLVQDLFATDGGQETGLIPLIGSIIGQEGEQTGYYRFLGNHYPSSAPFLTASAPEFAFTALKSFIVPGSCPDIKTIDIKTFEALTVLGTPTPTTTTLTYEIDGTVSATKNSLVYLSGQNFPVTVPITNVTPTYGGKTSFQASFPFAAKSFAKGLTVAAVVSGTGKSYSDGSAVAADTIYGPGLITVQ